MRKARGVAGSRFGGVQTYQLINSNYFNSAYFGRGLGQSFVDGANDLLEQHWQEIRARAIRLQFCHFIYYMVHLT